MLTWPSALPAPLWDPYSVSSVDVVERTPTDDGKFRSRPRAKKAPYIVEMAVALNAEQEILARSFHEYALHQGTDSFLMRLRSGGVMRAMTVQMTGRPTYSPLGPNAVRMAFGVIVHSDFGAVVWGEIGPEDGYYPLHLEDRKELGTLTGFTISRVYLFGREAFNGGTDTITIGWTDDTDSLVEVTAMPAAGSFSTVVAASSNSGIGLDVTQAGTKTILARYACDAAPTTGSLCIIIPFVES